MGRVSLSLALAAGALLVAPVSAPALVQVDEGIAGARLGNSRAEVRAALGRPAAIRTGTNEFGRYVEYRFAGEVRVFFQGRRRVSAVDTTGRGDRTASGVGVGSSERAVRRGVPGVRCETIEGTRACFTGAFEPGRRVTSFLLGADGRVERVAVGIVID
jgi:hypothetical protein